MLYRLQKLITILVALVLGSYTVAQSYSYRSFEDEADLSRKSEIAIELWNDYLRNDLDSLKILSHQLLALSVEKNNPFSKAVGEFCLSSFVIRKGQFDKGISHMNNAIEYFGKQENYEMLSIAYNELGHAYFLQGKYTDAIKMYSSSIKHGEFSPDPTSEFNGKLGLGKTYCAIGDTLEGVKFLHQYKNEALKKLKFESVADAYAYLGEVELLRNPSLAKSYFEKSIKFSIRSKSKAHLSHAYNNQAIIFFSLGNLDSSLIYFNRSLEIRMEMGHMKGIAESYNNLGFYFQELEDYPNAKSFYIKCVDHCRTNNFIRDELDALIELQTISQILNDKEFLGSVTQRIGELELLLEQSENGTIQELDEIEKLAGKELRSTIEEKDTLGVGIISMIAASILLIILFVFKRRKEG